MIGIIILVILALVMGLIIVLVENKLISEKEEKQDEKEILKLLPGYNCGGCGFVNCPNMAKEIINNKENIYKCRPLKNKEEVLKKINIILSE